MTQIQIVVMGVSGCGKSTVGRLLANEIGARFIDGDDLHPKSNRDKMASGIPLNDADREPWLEKVSSVLNGEPNPEDVFHARGQSGTVVACSALKRKYRDQILKAVPGVLFIHLHGPRAMLEHRLNERTGHFMKVDMLTSQLETLEQLASYENGRLYEISLSPKQIVSEVIKDFKLSKNN